MMAKGNGLSVSLNKTLFKGGKRKKMRGRSEGHEGRLDLENYFIEILTPSLNLKLMTKLLNCIYSFIIY